MIFLRSEPIPLRLALGGYLALGGCVGVVIALMHGVRLVEQLDPRVRTQAAGLLALIGAAFLLLVAAGVLVAADRRGGVALALVLQVFQVPLFAFGGTHFTFLGGLYGGASWAPGGIEPFGGWRASMQLGWTNPGPVEYVAINVVPLLVAGLLLRVHRSRVPSGHPGQVVYSPVAGGA